MISTKRKFMASAPEGGIIECWGLLLLRSLHVLQERSEKKLSTLITCTCSTIIIIIITKQGNCSALHVATPVAGCHLQAQLASKR